MSDRARSDSINEPETSAWSNSESIEGTLISPPSPELGEEPLGEGAAFADEDDRKCNSDVCHLRI